MLRLAPYDCAEWDFGYLPPVRLSPITFRRPFRLSSPGRPPAQGGAVRQVHHPLLALRVLVLRRRGEQTETEILIPPKDILWKIQKKAIGQREIRRIVPTCSLFHIAVFYAHGNQQIYRTVGDCHLHPGCRNFAQWPFPGQTAPQTRSPQAAGLYGPERSHHPRGVGADLLVTKGEKP
jgi:hypothetical protein